MTSLAALAILLLISERRAEDNLSTACSSVFHDTSNGSLLFHFSHPTNERFRDYHYSNGLIRGEFPLNIYPSPSFSCMLIFTSHQDSRLLVRVSDLQLHSDALKCADAIRVYSVLRGRLFLVREFCGNDNYAPAIITESNMAVVTVTFFDTYSQRNPRKFHLEVERHKNAFRRVNPPKLDVSISKVTHFPPFQIKEQPKEQHYEMDHEWNKNLNQLSELRPPSYDLYSSWTSSPYIRWNSGLSNRWNQWNNVLLNR